MKMSGRQVRTLEGAKSSSRRQDVLANHTTETIAPLDSTLARRRCPNAGLVGWGGGRASASVRSMDVVEVDNPTPLVLRLEKSGMRGHREGRARLQDGARHQSMGDTPRGRSCRRLLVEICPSEKRRGHRRTPPHDVPTGPWYHYGIDDSILRLIMELHQEAAGSSPAGRTSPTFS